MLRNEAMLIRCSISQWCARKYDKGASQKVADDYGTRSDVGRYNKVLIAKEAIQRITRVVSSARTYHYIKTLPWDDSGSRLLPACLFLEYSKKMREFKSEFEREVETFVSNYEQYREDAKIKLAGLFNKSDYPSVHEIKRKYGFTTDIYPIPAGSDFRVSVSEKDKKEIQESIEQAVKNRVEGATKDLYYRLADVLKKFTSKLSESDGVFRDTLVGNIVELVQLIPSLNVTNDPKLEDLRKEVQSKISQIEPDTLRSDSGVRKNAVNDADEILKKMKAYIS